MISSKEVLVAFVSMFYAGLIYARGPLDVNQTDKLNRGRQLSFIENKGQVVDQFGNPRRDIDFKIASAGLNVFIGRGAIHYQFSRLITNKCETHAFYPLLASPVDANESEYEMYRMDVELVGANENAEIITGNRQNSCEKYFLEGNGSIPTSTYAYDIVTYKNVYNNIDWVFYLNDGRVEYDFVVHPGGDPAQIELRYKGANNITITEDGNIRSSTPFGNIIERHPICFEMESKRDIASTFSLRKNVVRFNLRKSDYDKSKTLIIDPTLDWSTYYGDIDQDFGVGVCCDVSGNVYLAGYTRSPNNIATTGSYSTYAVSNGCTFLTKFNTSGNRLWAIYYYGNAFSSSYNGNPVICDPSGNVYLTGTVNSTMSGLATNGCYQAVSGGGFDVYLAKFDSSGSVIWATYFGGNKMDGSQAVVCDPSGNVYITGFTYSSSGIASPGAYQTSLIDTEDQFIAKFSSSGALQWSTYFGTAGNGSIRSNLCGIACDNSNNVFITGSSSSLTNIASPGSYQSTNGGGALDGYIAKLDGNGTLLWSSYFGGSSTDISNAIACDNLGNAYITGYTLSSNNIASAGAAQGAISPNGYDAFLAKFNTNGSRVWGTYMGGPGQEFAGNVKCDAIGNIYITGLTSSLTGIATAGAYNTIYPNAQCVYFEKYDPMGTRQWGTYFGGSYTTSPMGLACDLYNNIYFCGGTHSQSGIATPGSFQSNLSSILYDDAFLTKWLGDSFFTVAPPQRLMYCEGDTFSLTFYSNHTYQTGNVFQVQLSDSSGNFTNPQTIGTLSSVSAGAIFCTIPPATLSGGNYQLRILSSNPIDSTAPFSAHIRISAIPVFTVSSNSPVCDGRVLSFNTSSLYTGLSYKWTGPNNFVSTSSAPSVFPVSSLSAGYYYVKDSLFGCSANDSIYISIKPGPTSATASSNEPCKGANLYLNANASGTGLSYVWMGPNNFYSTNPNPVILNTTWSDSGMYKVVFSLSNGCTDTINVDVTIHSAEDTPSITISGPQTICSGTIANFIATTINTGTSPQYQWKINSVNVPGATGSVFSSTGINNGDFVSCIVSSSVLCQPVNTAISNFIQVHVTPVTPVSVYLTVYPSIYKTGDAVTFTGHVPVGNFGFTYQWKINGVEIPWAKLHFLTSTDVGPGDSVCLIVHTTAPCVYPDSSVACTVINAMDINEEKELSSDIKVYPNPVSNLLNVEAPMKIICSIESIGGQNIVTKTCSNSVDVSTLPDGLYLLRIYRAEDVLMIKTVKIVKIE